MNRKKFIITQTVTLAMATTMLIGASYKHHRTIENKEAIISQQEIELNKYGINIENLEEELSKSELEREKLSISINDLKVENKKILEKNSKLQSDYETLKKKVESENALMAKTGHESWTRLDVQATGYSLIDDPMGSDGTPETATGTYPKPNHTIAVDPRVIPYGTQVYIPSTGQTYVAEDTGGMIKGNKIDIYFGHGREARVWGRQNIEVYVNYKK